MKPFPERKRATQKEGGGGRLRNPLRDLMTCDHSKTLCGIDHLRLAGMASNSNTAPTNNNPAIRSNARYRFPVAAFSAPTAA